MIWCILLWFGVICIFFGGNQFFSCDLGVICFRMIWCDIIEVRLGLTWFVYRIAWCDMVWFRVIFTFFGSKGYFIVWFRCD